VLGLVCFFGCSTQKLSALQSGTDASDARIDRGALPADRPIEPKDADIDQIQSACVGPSGITCLDGDCESDVEPSAICVGTTWVCPPGSINIDTCPGPCIGRPPSGCTCGDGGWKCS
jgi:hypothetical protein